MIGTRSVSELSFCRDEVESYAELIKMMLGKVVVEHYVPSTVDYNSKVLGLTDVSNKKLHDISFALYKGEILGFYGLVGSGKTEIVRVVYGLDESEGSIEIQGKMVQVRDPRTAIVKGISMVPEERRTEGLFTKLSIRENIPIMNMKTVSRYGIASKRKERQIARKYIDEVHIVARDEDQRVALLSGGNQQKVVVSKCLNAESAILLLDEPTRGIDVGAKEEIHNIIRQLSSEGASIIVFSSELPEIINLCDRIILLYDGKIKSEMKNGEGIDTERIMHIVTGGKGDIDAD
jgi:ABC-type sugar transport system ATPase subunit